MSSGIHQPDSQYIHGASPVEQQRLSMLNDLLNNACLKQLNLTAERRILDVGSGLGQFTRLMAKSTLTPPYVLGIERSEEQLARARQFAEIDKEKHLVSFRKGDATMLPLDAEEWGHFDLVHSRFVLEHVPDPSLVVAQMVAACRPGGRVVVADDDHDIFRLYPESPGFHELWNAYIRSYDRLGNDPFIGRKLVQLLQQAGLQNIHNTFIFFGDCSGNATFEAFVDNIIGVINSAKEVILANKLLTKGLFNQAIKSLNQWKKRPDAALWYAMNWAEGMKNDS